MQWLILAAVLVLSLAGPHLLAPDALQDALLVAAPAVALSPLVGRLPKLFELLSKLRKRL